ncbi:hypothetical protein OXX59_001523, partial [Metschnikowia pulcherrima]
MKLSHIFLAFAAQLMAALAAKAGCLATSVISQGLYVNFYKYPYRSMVYQTDPNFYFSGYKQFGYLHSVGSVTSANVDIWLGRDRVDYSSVYGYSITYTNFTMDLSGWFLADQTGDYTFSLYGDDGASIQFGTVSGCCGRASDVVSGYTLDARYPGSSSATFSLVKGTYYPIKIVYVNWIQRLVLRLTYKDPSGRTVSDIGSHIYQIKQDEICEVTTTNYWTGSVTSATTVYPSDGGRPTVTVDVPPTTTTTYWTNDYTSTTTYSPDGGRPTVIVELPPKTSTTYWTNDYTSTTTVTPSDGGEPTVIVEVPNVRTSTSTWTGSYTTLTTVTGTDGIETPVVEVPGVKTSTFTWTGS